MRFFIIFFVILCFSSRANADFTEHQKQKFTLHLGLQPIYAFAELNLHEGSHALAFISTGHSIKEYSVFPSFQYTETGRKFFMGYVRADTQLSSNETIFSSIAPQITNITLFAASDIALSYIDKDSVVAPYFLFGGMVWTWINFVSCTNAWTSGTDIYTFSKYSGIPQSIPIIIGNSLAVIGAIRIYLRMQDIMFISNKNKIENRVYITFFPMIMGTGMGVGIVGGL